MNIMYLVCFIIGFCIGAFVEDMLDDNNKVSVLTPIYWLIGNVIAVFSWILHPRLAYRLFRCNISPFRYRLLQICELSEEQFKWVLEVTPKKVAKNWIEAYLGHKKDIVVHSLRNK